MDGLVDGWMDGKGRETEGERGIGIFEVKSMMSRV
jgi:hypothetical protein